MSQAETFADQLVAAGLDAADAADKRTLFARVLAAWRAGGQGEPTRAWWVPGRLEVFGTHTD